FGSDSRRTALIATGTTCGVYLGDCESNCAESSSSLFRPYCCWSHATLNGQKLIVFAPTYTAASHLNLWAKLLVSIELKILDVLHRLDIQRMNVMFPIIGRSLAFVSIHLGGLSR